MKLNYGDLFPVQTKWEERGYPGSPFSEGFLLCSLCGRILNLFWHFGPVFIRALRFPSFPSIIFLPI